MSRNPSRKDLSHKAEHVNPKLEHSATSRDAPIFKKTLRESKERSPYRASIPAKFASSPVQQTRLQAHPPVIGLTQSQNQSPIQERTLFDQHIASQLGNQQQDATTFAESSLVNSRGSRYYSDLNSQQQQRPGSQVHHQLQFRQTPNWPSSSIPPNHPSTRLFAEQQYSHSPSLQNSGSLYQASLWDKVDRTPTPVQNRGIPVFLQKSSRDLNRFAEKGAAHIRTQSMEQFEQLTYGEPYEVFESPPEVQDTYNEMTHGEPLAYPQTHSESPQFGVDSFPPMNHHRHHSSAIDLAGHPTLQMSHRQMTAPPQVLQQAQIQQQAQVLPHSRQHQRLPSSQLLRPFVSRPALPEQHNVYNALALKQQLGCVNSVGQTFKPPPLDQAQPYFKAHLAHRPAKMASPPLDSQAYTGEQFHAQPTTFNSLVVPSSMQPIDSYSGYPGGRDVPDNSYLYETGPSLVNSEQRPLNLEQPPAVSRETAIKIKPQLGLSPLSGSEASSHYPQYTPESRYNHALPNSEDHPLANLGSHYLSETRTQWLKEDEDELMSLLESGEKYKWRYVSDIMIFSERCRVPANACLAKFKALFGEHETESELKSSLFYVAHPQGWAALANLTPRPDRNSTARS